MAGLNTMNTQKRLFSPRPSHCLTCVAKKLKVWFITISRLPMIVRLCADKCKCKGGGPGDGLGAGSCVACSYRELNCVWGPVPNESGWTQKACRAPSSDDDGKDLVPEKRPRKANGPLIAPKILLPCPYFLKDPVRPRKNKACFGPGWDVARLK